jgi:hypothetical protein
MQGGAVAIAAGERARIHGATAAGEIHALRRERSVGKRTGGEGAGMRRSTAKMPGVEMAAAMVPAAEMVPVASATMTAAVMAATVMTAAATTTVTTAMTAFRDREVCDRQRRRENDRGNSHCDP